MTTTGARPKIAQIVPLLDGRVEAVHVDVDDLPLTVGGPSLVAGLVSQIVGPAGLQGAIG